MPERGLVGGRGLVIWLGVGTGLWLSLGLMPACDPCVDLGCCPGLGLVDGRRVVIGFTPVACLGAACRLAIALLW